MQNDFFERGIGIVPVRVPTAGPDVHLDIALRGRLLAKLDYRVPEIRASLNASEAGMQNAHPLATPRGKLLTQQALMLPDSREQTLGRRLQAPPQQRNAPASPPPLRVKAGQSRRHLAIA